MELETNETKRIARAIARRLDDARRALTDEMRACERILATEGAASSRLMSCATRAAEARAVVAALEPLLAEVSAE